MSALRCWSVWLPLLLGSCAKHEHAGEMTGPALAAAPAAPAATQRPPGAPPNDPPKDAQVTASGLTMQVLAPGTGDMRPRPQDKVRVHFSAWNTRGELTDGSQARGGPVLFEVDGVIRGWSEALQQMHIGEKRRLWVPDHLTYPGRPGNPRPAALFEIELLEILPGPDAEPAPADLAAAPRDATRLPSGLTWKRLQHDESHAGAPPRAWDRVQLIYAGWAEDGRMFSSSKRQPEWFELGKVIPSWQDVLVQMAVQDKARLWVPQALASHGKKGEPPGKLVYDLELVAIERGPEPPRAPAALNAPPANAERTTSGLSYRFLTRGREGRRPGPHDRVTVHYSAWTRDGKLFDSSVHGGKPRTVPLDRLITGWSEGLQLMAEGDKAQLWIPEDLAYRGREGAPRGDLIYEVELLQVSPAP